MFITKKHIPRRAFLKGAGSAVALPMLEAMLPAQTPQRLTDADPDKIRRFVGIWHPHGAAPGYWSPVQEGKDFEFSFITRRRRKNLPETMHAGRAYSREPLRAETPRARISASRSIN